MAFQSVRLDGDQADWLREIRDILKNESGDDGSGSSSGSGSGSGSSSKKSDKFLTRLGQTIRDMKYDVKSLISDVQRINDAWAQVDHAASQYTKTLGGTAAAMEKLRKQTINTVVKGHIGVDFNVSMEELLRAQQQYVQGVGRALRLDKTQQTSLAAMTSVMGAEGATRLGAALENFGISLNGTANHVGRMWKEAAEAGISFEKYSENVRENITIAQNYTFRNGIRGLESMAKKATAIKMDMRQIEAFASKVNTLEGSMETAAKLQVLGGPFASLSDPLGMLNEGLMDMEGLMDRVTRMVGGLGSFNKATGEVVVSAFNKTRIRAAAEAMGMDYSQLMTSINAQARRNEIEKQIRASGNPNSLNEKMLELFKNSATFNEQGVAGVSINGEFKTLSDLKNNDYTELIKETQSESADIKDIAKSVRSLVDIRQGARKQYEANKALIQETIGSGQFEKYVTNKLGSINTALQFIAGFSMFSDIVGLVGNFGKIIGRVGQIFKGSGGAANAINRVVGGFGRSARGAVANGVNRSVGSNGVRNFISSTGKKYTVDATGKVFNASGKVMPKNIAEQVLGSVKNGGHFVEDVAKGTKVTKVASAASKASKVAKVGGVANIAKVGRGGGILAGVTEGVLTGIDEFGTEKNYGTAKKVGRTAGSAIGAGAATFGIGAALASTGVGLIPGLLLMAAGGLAGGSIGKWIGGGFASQERRERWKKNLGLEDVQGDYSVKKLKRIEKALDTGVLDDSLRRELLKKGDRAVVEQIKKVRDEKEARKAQNIEKNIAEAYFNVDRAYFTTGGVKGRISQEEIARARGSLMKDMNDSLTWGPFAGIAMLTKRMRRGSIAGHMEKGENAMEMSLSDITKRLVGAREGEGPLDKKANIPSSLTINVNGAIKLTDGAGKTIDIAGQLLKDSVFVRDLARLISKQLRIDEKATNVVQKSGQ